MSGYALTGVTSEHALFFIYGTGANGKSTFLKCVRRLPWGLSPDKRNRDIYER